MLANTESNELMSGYATMSLVILIAASNYVVCKIALRDITPFSLMSFRYLLASGLMYLFVHSRLRHVDRHLIVTSIMLGCFLSFAVITWQMGIASASRIGPAAFIVSLDGLFVPLFACLLYRHRLTPNVLLALPLALVGLALLNLGEHIELEVSDIWFFASAIGFSLHILLTHRYSRVFDGATFVWLQMCCVAVFTTAFALAFESGNYSFGSLLGVFHEVLYLGIVATALRFFLQNYAQGRISATSAGFLFVLEPVCVALMAWIVFSEVFSAAQVLGSFLILVSLLVSHSRMTLRRLLKRKHLPAA